MAAIGRTTSSALTYHGPNTSTFLSYGIVSANTQASILWKEGTFYYAEFSSPNRRLYIPSSAVVITSGSVITYNPSISTRYVSGDGGIARFGSSSAYVTSVAPDFPQTVGILAGKTEGSYSFIEYQRKAEAGKRRAWFETSKLTTSKPTPGNYTHGHTINSDGETWYKGNPWNGYLTSTSKTWSYGHLGVDIQRHLNSTQVTGKEVYAIAAGTVVATGYNSGNGNVVVIRHTINGKNYYSYYCHLSSYYNRTSVSEGEAIGVMGSTGNSDAPHVHICITRDNEGVDNPGYHKVNTVKTKFVETGPGYLDYNSTRYFNPDKYFSDGASFISNNYN